MKAYLIPADYLRDNPFAEKHMYKIYHDGEHPVATRIVRSKPQLFYIWGHSYEMDAEYISWDKFEEFCKMISEKEDIFYGTNSEVLL